MLAPEDALLGARRPGGASAERLLYLWLIDGGRARFAQLMAILRGNTDPMHWVWFGRPEPDEPRLPWLAGTVSILKMVAYQLWLYLAASSAWPRPSRSERRRRPGVGWEA